MTSKPLRLGRRRFGALALAAGATIAAPAIAQRAVARIVVVGGGAAGATAARAMAELRDVEVTLITERPTYTTPFFSNLYLAGYRSLSSLTHRYDILSRKRRVQIVTARALDIDRQARLVQVQGEESVGYDRLILAPGVSFVAGGAEGYDAKTAVTAPHAYGGGLQSYLLKQRLMTMRAGGVFVICAPPDPSRCPTAPYERASMAALYFRRKNPTAKVLILDAKESFPQQRLFEAAWWEQFPGVIEWVPASKIGGGVARIDAETLTLTDRTGGRTKADAVSFIPAQRAGEIVIRAGLADRTGWAPVEPASMRSTIDRNIYVIGDSARAGDMPKLASAAASQADRAAFALEAELDEPFPPAPEYRSAIWSFVGPQNALKNDVLYRVEGGSIRAFSFEASASDETSTDRRDNALAANAWYAAITAGAFD